MQGFEFTRIPWPIFTFLFGGPHHLTCLYIIRISDYPKIVYVDFNYMLLAIAWYLGDHTKKFCIQCGMNTEYIWSDNMIKICEFEEQTTSSKRFKDGCLLNGADPLLTKEGWESTTSFITPEGVYLHVHIGLTHLIEIR